MLAFDSQTHTYAWNGKPVPGVTSILKPVSPGFDGIPPAVLRKARERGTGVHKTIELFEANKLDFESVHPEVMRRLLQWQRFREESGAELLETESMVYHPSFGYAGTLDLRLRIDGKAAIVDTKASWAIPVTAGPQTAAYAAAYEAQHNVDAHDRYVLHLKDKHYRLEKMRDRNDIGVFLSCLTVWRFNNARSGR